MSEEIKFVDGKDMRKPAITIHWDPDTQMAALEWDPEQIKNPAFAVAVLEMMAVAAKRADNLSAAMQMQAAQQQNIAKAMHAQNQAQQIKRRVLQP